MREGSGYLHHPVALQAPDLSVWQASPTGVPYVHERDSGLPGPQVLITALVHGNEYAGALALDAFLHSGLQPTAGRITAIFCNVAAFARFNLTQPDASRYLDEDFNRVWGPHVLDGSPTTAERARAQQILPYVQRATHLLDLHSMHEPAPPLLVTGLLPRNVAFAQALGSGVQAIIDSGHADGVRLRDHGTFADPAGNRIALLLEAGQHWQASSLQVSRNVFMRFLVAAGALSRGQVPADWCLPDAPAAQAVEVTHRVVAQSMDFAFTNPFTGGETIATAGTVIAHDAGQPICTPYDHCVLVMPSVRQLRPGVTTVRLGRRVHANAD
jgi:predicted deacylase